MAKKNPLDAYPRTITLAGDEKIELRPMTGSDGDAILDFARALPEEDLLFLRVDLTQPDAVEQWVQSLDSGRTVSLLAWSGNMLVGYATIHREPARWTRRMGEIRVNVGSEYRSLGLGRNLVSSIFDVARSLGLKKLLANMTTDQIGAQKAFRRLGFTPEALLADTVEDRNGNMRDMVIMSYDVDGHHDSIEEPLRL